MSCFHGGFASDGESAHDDVVDGVSLSPFVSEMGEENFIGGRTMKLGVANDMIQPAIEVAPVDAKVGPQVAVDDDMVPHGIDIVVVGDDMAQHVVEMAAEDDDDDDAGYYVIGVAEREPEALAGQNEMVRGHASPHEIEDDGGLDQAIREAMVRLRTLRTAAANAGIQLRPIANNEDELVSEDDDDDARCYVIDMAAREAEALNMASEAHAVSPIAEVADDEFAGDDSGQEEALALPEKLARVTLRDLFIRSPVMRSERSVRRRTWV